jgi:hypothetical protein
VSDEIGFVVVGLRRGYRAANEVLVNQAIYECARSGKPLRVDG